MNRYSLAKGKESREFRDPDDRSMSPVTDIDDAEKNSSHLITNVRCSVCEEVIDLEWLKTTIEVPLCRKRSCWEKFLPMDIVNKFFRNYEKSGTEIPGVLKPNDRYRILKGLEK